MRVRRVPVMIVVAIPAVFAGDARAQEPALRMDTPSLSVTRDGLTAQATVGSFCAGWCVDTSYPLPIRGRLPVRPGGRVLLTTSVAARELDAQLVRVRGRRFKELARLTVRQRSPHRWVATLPARLRGANRVDVFIRWRNNTDGDGDASFQAGIRTGCR